MVTLNTWAGKSCFSYTGSVKEGTEITYGDNNTITISAADYNKLLLYFNGLTVEIGTSRDKPPSGSLGEWLQNNITKTAVASYIGPVLINEGYAKKASNTSITFDIFICEELVRAHKNVGKVNLNRFNYLHSDGKNLILSWHDRAQAMYHDPDSHFEAFIYAWIAFNGWAACVTEIDADRKWLNALMLDNALAELFNNKFIENNNEHNEVLRCFGQLWPIFKAQEIRRRGVTGNESNRDELIRHYINAGIRNYEPQCYKRHKDNKEIVPLDWAHTLATLYRVRCNLFHGEKSRDSENDHRIVSSAFKVLLLIENELFY